MSTFDNFVQCRVASPIAASTTSLELYAAVAPYNLPPETGGVLVLTDSPGNPSRIEVIRYASRSALGLYGVERGQEGTTAIEWTGPVYCYQALMAGDFTNLLESKVDKEPGYSLIEDTEATRLSNMETGATKNRADSLNADKLHAHSVEQVAGLGTAATKDVGTAVGQVINNSGASLMGAIASASNPTTLSGFWEITLPYQAGSTIMLAFQIKEYSGYTLSTIEVSGYLYSAIDNWYLPQCTIVGSVPPAVRFGKNAAGFAVIVVSTNAYSGIGIYNAVSGYLAPVNLHGATITWHDSLPDRDYVGSTTILANTSANLQQAPGTSTDFPMSQAAITNQLATKADTLSLGYAATAPTVGDGVDVMRTGAYGLGGTTTIRNSYPVSTTQTGFSYFANPTDPALPQYGMSVVFGGRATTNTADSGNWLGQLYSDTVNTLIFRTSINGGEWGPPVTLYHSANMLNIGTTAASARTALELVGEWVDLRPYLKAGFYYDSARNGRNSYPRIRKLSCGRVELDGIVSFNATSGPVPIGVFVNVPAQFRPPLTVGGLMFGDTASPLSFGAVNWLVIGQVEYSPPAVHGDISAIPLTLASPAQNGAFSINGIYWFT